MPENRDKMLVSQSWNDTKTKKKTGGLIGCVGMADAFNVRTAAYKDENVLSGIGGAMKTTIIWDWKRKILSSSIIPGGFTDYDGLKATELFKNSRDTFPEAIACPCCDIGIHPYIFVDNSYRCRDATLDKLVELPNAKTKFPKYEYINGPDHTVNTALENLRFEILRIYKRIIKKGIPTFVWEYVC